MDIEEMLNEFNDSTDDAKKQLRTMFKVISKGKVPKESDVERLGSSIERLRQVYDAIYSLAVKQAAAEEMPAEGLSVAEYVQVIRNSAAALYKKQLEGIRKILEKFVSVRSLVSPYAAALQPFQKQTEELIFRINSDEKPDMEELEREAAGPRVFLEILACDDLDSDEGINLLDQVGAFYCPRIQNGLAAGKYGFSEKLNESDSKSAGVEETSWTETPEKDETVTQYTQKEAEIEISDSAAASELIEQEEVSEFVRKVVDSGLLLDESVNIGSFSREISPNEDRKITVSIFQNDIRKSNGKALRAVLKEVAIKNHISPRLLNLMKRMPEDFAGSLLGYLQRKGYLRKYTLLPGREFYCASPRLKKALSFRDAAKMIDVRQRPAEDWEENDEDKMTSVICRIVYEKLYCDSVQRFIDAGCFSFRGSSIAFSDCFFSRIYPSDMEDINCDIIIGVFWDNTEECAEYFEQMREDPEKGEPAGSVIFAALNQEKARCLADIMLDEFGSTISSGTFYLYSFSDDCYYTYPDGDKIEEGEVGRKTKDFDEPDESDDKNETEDMTDISEPETPASEDNDEVSRFEKASAEMAVCSLERKKQNKLVSKTAPPDREIFEENTISLINSGKLYAAMAYVRAFSLQYPEYTPFCNQLAYALNDPMGRCSYSTKNAFELIDKKGEFEDALVIATAIRTFFSNQIRYEYNIKSYYSGIKGYRLLSDYPVLSKVLYSLMDFKDSYQTGMDAYADYRFRNKAELDQRLRRTRQEAQSFYDNFVIGQKKENASQKRFLETKKLIFSADSDLGQYIKAIVDDDTGFQPLVLEFLRENFYKEDSAIEEDTIDDDKLWGYITVHWEKAGKSMVYNRHENLMSHLRNNIISTTTKAVQLLAVWCDLVCRISNHTEDDGEQAYRKIRKPLLDNLETAIYEIRKVCENREICVREEAGLRILIYTLEEVRECINGSYVQGSKRYFYVPFLLTDDLMLDENYFPDMDMHSSDLQSLYPTVRILDHVCKLRNEQPDFTDQPAAILDKKGDDYGAAKLIVDYLMEKNPSEQLSEISLTIDSCKARAKEKADINKDDFIGNLELAQSYGQIDNSAEDKKEKILQVVDEWYKWSVETSNYGFFKRVMDSYLMEIKEEAKAREKDLLEQLASFRAAVIPGLSTEEKEKRAVRIQRMVSEQNYTVAEDLLARSDAFEEEYEEVIEEDFLKDFLDNYDDYYQPVAAHNVSFAALVSGRTRNKEQRGAKKLADNWLPGGSELGVSRLENLLNCFGFKVSGIKPQNVIGKFEHFSVCTAKAKGGQRDNYTHPIAAFGSGAALDGFRVVCINGAYDADSLIEIMKQVGNAKHTMILYDNALPVSERRRLARKTKNALGDKLFGIVDRTVMMFLVRNYDETKMNKMLVSLITPFGYYQPYVWESANVMPPEIFMGRKHELEKIKSPTGVNIVYGGRQLGKSALLKKAKEDIDYDENGNRAVLVDIKGLDYKKAVKKIAHELYDAHVLEQDIDTENWDELARAVRQRLQSDKNRIPYLLLLLDEADVFIESCASVNYQPFDALKDIQGIGTGRFKFVIAGLRNIVRFKREALGNNSVLTHLESMTVKPFNVSEARELMEIPLHYLGLRFSKEKESLITLILATTNYFPGLIQMYCAKLIDAMRNKDYANYNEVDTPIYEVSEEHIKKVLADPEFTRKIREKYNITLDLDEDNYYYLIALLMAFLYHNNGYNEGYSAADIKNVGVEWEIAKIADLENTKLESLMEEMKELNVLRSTDETHYLFTRFTFFQMMGTRTEVDDKLEEYMGE